MESLVSFSCHLSGTNVLFLAERTLLQNTWFLSLDTWPPVRMEATKHASGLEFRLTNNLYLIAMFLLVVLLVSLTGRAGFTFLI